ncbi:MAG TPA: FAD-dependent oxidoreductase [Candidatus Aminicenantes bacterium]|nr:FAD-dependent oxidoreductase [Candidatus Aminicenantes bacterium]
MPTIPIVFNGRPVEVQGGLTILQVATDLGVEIPTLCHDERLRPFGSCFLCVVEVEGARSFLPACATAVTAGMKIHTHSEAIARVRQMCLELLLSNHHADCKAPCTLTCPASVDVQGYIAHIAAGNYRQAVALVKERNPFPLSIGRVCTRPCEGKCRRGVFDDPVGIDYLKRFVADWDLHSEAPYVPEIVGDYPERVAIVGAGPGGLTAAYYLAILGYKPEVFEKLPAMGGMFRYGIPEYRLPKGILDAEIELITRLGIPVHLGQELGRDFSLSDLRARGFAAILLAVGAQAGMPMKVQGEDLPGVLIGVDFLRQVGLGQAPEIRGRVAVIGGGNTAMDAARTSLRLGAGKVMVLYRRTREEMPANEAEVEEAIEEGIEFHYLTAPIEVRGQGKAERLRCLKMALGEPDASGRRRPVPVEGSEFEIEVDHVIAAIGQAVEPSFGRLEATPPEMSRRGSIAVREGTYETSLPGVFAIGDAVTGPQAAIDAIAGAGAASKTIHAFLRTGSCQAPVKEFVIRKEDFAPVTAEDFSDEPPVPREKMAVLAPAVRRGTFAEIEQGFTEAQALAEAARCLECGCKDVFECRLKKYSGEYQARPDRLVGSYKRLKVQDDHPYIRIEPEKCINCGRCVRICSEVQAIHAWGFVARGFDARIEPTFGDPLIDTACETCGQCVQACPVGALTEKSPTLKKPGPFQTRETQSICTLCGVGCGTRVHTVDGIVIRVTGDGLAPSSRGNLCRRGRFGAEVAMDGKRLTKPLLRREGILVPVTMDEARRVLREKVAAAGSPRLILGESLPQEAFHLLSGLGFPSWSFAQETIRPLLSAVAGAGLGSLLGGNEAEWQGASDCWLLGEPLAESHPVLLLELIRALKAGKQLVVIGPVLDDKLRQFQGHGLTFLAAAPEAMAETLTMAATRADLGVGPRPMVFSSGLPSVGAKALVTILERWRKAGLTPRLVIAGSLANSGGAMLERRLALTAPDLTTPADVLITVREDPLGTVERGREQVEDWYRRAGFRITADCRLSETAAQSDLVIPVEGPFETSGTYFNVWLRRQLAVAALRPVAECSLLALAEELRGTIGAPVAAPAAEAILDLAGYRAGEWTVISGTDREPVTACRFGGDVIRRVLAEDVFGPRLDSAKRVR